MLSAFVDDSGRDGLPVFVLCALVSSDERWDNFSREWNALRSQELDGRAFKMKQFMKSLSCEKFEVPGIERLHKFQDIMNRNVEYGLVVIVSVDHYRSFIAGKTVKKEWQREYNFAVSRVVRRVVNLEYLCRRQKPVKFIFDTQLGEDKFIRNWWVQNKKNAPGRVRRRMGESPVWGRDEDYPPLQAADMVAWAFRRDSADVLGDAGVLNPQRKNHALFHTKILSTRFPKTVEELTPAVGGVVISRLLSKARPVWRNLKVPIVKEIWGETEFEGLQQAMAKSFSTSSPFGSRSGWGT